jgi:hypothetical protein
MQKFITSFCHISFPIFIVVVVVGVGVGGGGGGGDGGGGGCGVYCEFDSLLQITKQKLSLNQYTTTELNKR